MRVLFGQASENFQIAALLATGARRKPAVNGILPPRRIGLHHRTRLVEHRDMGRQGIKHRLLEMAGNPQGLFSHFLLADVDMRTDHALGLTVSVAADDGAAGKHPFPAAILALAPKFNERAGGLAAQARLMLADHTILIVGMDAGNPVIKVMPVFFLGKTIELLEAPGKNLLARHHVPVPHTIAGSLQRQLPAFLAGAQLFFCQPAFGDIHQNDLPALGRPQPCHLDLHMRDQRPFVGKCQFTALHVTGVGGLRQQGIELRAVGVGHEEPESAPQQAGALAAQQTGPGKI